MHTGRSVLILDYQPLQVQMALELANDHWQRAQDISLRSVDDIDAELSYVLQMVSFDCAV